LRVSINKELRNSKHYSFLENDEWGYFSLDELASYRGRFGLGIERDLHFGERRASEVIKK